ncbi:hypothetical protein B5S33_g1094 [[Candida] boidinii]|nr:hypothetical protein B5S33_g1094 [[Candida] boidinii]
MLPNRVLYRTGIHDPVTNSPLYIFDTSLLPQSVFSSFINSTSSFSSTTTATISCNNSSSLSLNISSEQESENDTLNSTSHPTTTANQTSSSGKIINKNVDESNVDNYINELISLLPSNEEYSMILFAGGLNAEEYLNTPSTQNSTSNYTAITSNNEINDSISSTAQPSSGTLPSPSSLLSSAAPASSSFIKPTNSQIINLPRRLLKLLKIVPQEKKNLLTKLYVVHGNWLIKSIMEIYKTFWNISNKKREIIHCENLTKLAQFFNITNIPISLTNYIYDKFLFDNPKIIIDDKIFIPQRIFGSPLILSNIYSLKHFISIYNNLIAFLTTPELETEFRLKDWTTILKGNLNNETQITVDILAECLTRNQLLYLQDYSFLEHYIILSRFITALSDFNQPIFPINILSNEKLDLDDISTLNKILNDLINYQHRYDVVSTQNYQQQNYRSSPPASSSTSSSSPSSSSSSKSPSPYVSPRASSDDLLKSISTKYEYYDNGFLIIKILRLFYQLKLKLNKEYQILEPNSKNLEKINERQQLRLVLSFTKILYNEDEISNLDIGFDNLFKFLNNILSNWDNLIIFKTHKLNDFARLINLNDLNDFQSLKKNPAFKSPIFENIKLISKIKKGPAPPLPRRQQPQSQSVQPQSQSQQQPYMPPRKTYLNNNNSASSITTQTNQNSTESESISTESTTSEYPLPLSPMTSESSSPNSISRNDKINTTKILNKITNFTQKFSKSITISQYNNNNNTNDKNNETNSTDTNNDNNSNNSTDTNNEPNTLTQTDTSTSSSSTSTTIAPPTKTESASQASLPQSQTLPSIQSTISPPPTIPSATKGIPGTPPSPSTQLSPFEMTMTINSPDRSLRHMGSRNTLVRPSEHITSKFIKYTERDMMVQQQTKAKPDYKELTKKSIRGRNVSRLTLMYEEKFATGE